MSEGWKYKALGKLGTLTSSKRIYKKEYIAEGVPFYRSKEIKELAHGREISLELFISHERYNEIKFQFGIPQEGDLLLTAVGTIGEIYIVKKNEPDFYFKDGNIMWLKDFETLDPYFLKYTLTLFVEQLKAMSQGSAYNALTIEKLKKYAVPEPSISEQQQIVEILDQAFEAIDQAKGNIEKNIENAKELFQSKLNDIFSQKGEGWEEKKLGEVCDMIKRGVAPKYIEEGGLIVINQKCIRNHKINLEVSRNHDVTQKKVNPERLIKLGDVLVNSTGTGTLGRVAQVREFNHIGCTVDTHVTIVRPIEGLFVNDFFGYALIKIEKEIIEGGEGASGQTELSRVKLEKEFKICYPSSKILQKEYALQLDSLTNKRLQLHEYYSKKLISIEELKKSILQKAFAGELTNKTVEV